MENKTKLPATFLRRRKRLLLLPLMTIPFVTLFFWALGGGKGQGRAQVSLPGLNTALPDAELKEEERITKLQFYERADKRAREIGKTFTPHAFRDSTEDAGQAIPFSYDPASIEGGILAEGQEAKIYQRLEQLNRQLQSTEGERNVRNRPSSSVAVPPNQQLPESSESLPHSEKRQKEKDPELEQLNAMMDKILDIQHPHRLSNAHPIPAKDLGPVPTVEAGGASFTVSLLDSVESHHPAMENRFYGMPSPPTGPGETTIIAVFHHTQKLKEGGVAKLRLLQGFKIGKHFIPPGTFLSGIARQQGARLQVQITTLRYGQAIFPLALQVYDMDGLEGIYIGEAAGNEAVRGTVDRSLQQLQLSSLDPSFEAKAASAGVQAARSLLSKRAKQQEVILTEGYQVLLRNKNNQTQVTSNF